MSEEARNRKLYPDEELAWNRVLEAHKRLEAARAAATGAYTYTPEQTELYRAQAAFRLADMAWYEIVYANGGAS